MNEQRSDFGHINVTMRQMYTHFSLHMSSFLASSCQVTPCLLTHQVGHYLAHGRSEDEVLEDAGDESEGHAEDSHHQVTEGERQQEGVGHSAHALVDRQHHDDEQVANDAQEEDERVEQDPQCVVPV